MRVLFVSYDDIGNPVTPVLMYASTERLLFLCREWIPPISRAEGGCLPVSEYFHGRRSSGVAGQQRAGRNNLTT